MPESFKHLMESVSLAARTAAPKWQLTLRACISIGAAAVLTTLWFNPAFGAECIYPIDEVITGAILRAKPTTGSAQLGQLKPGQSLPFISAGVGWYQTRAPGGQSAYVSKRWTMVAVCEAGTTPAPVTPLAVALPVPLLARGHAVDWWFAFKLNAAKFPGCGNSEPRGCPFGGTVRSYTVGQQFAFASSDDAHLKQGSGCAGVTANDPIGATFDEAYNGTYHYVVWNDQFKGDPTVTGCGADCASPWGHSKGMVVWNDSGAGFVLQVTTPSWPGAGNQAHPRQLDGNTLGCVLGNNVKFSQHFFALKITKEDLTKVLHALRNASVGTDPENPQIASNGGPADIQSLVTQLGRKSSSTTATRATLSSGVQLISKPSKLHVPPWQMVSSLLGGIPLRTATWWANPAIKSTTATSRIDCWDTSLGAPGAVDIATSGRWNGTAIGLRGFVANGNHAKIGVSTDADSNLSILGDLNQQGVLSDANCGRSQNGRGGLFFVIKNRDLSSSISALIDGESAPVE